MVIEMNKLDRMNNATTNVSRDTTNIFSYLEVRTYVFCTTMSDAINDIVRELYDVELYKWALLGDFLKEAEHRIGQSVRRY